MKQAVLVGARRSEIRDIGVPAIGARDVLVRVRVSGVCASELHGWEDGHDAPYPLGHEVAGEVAAIGPEVTQFQVGDRVTGLFGEGFSDYAATSEDRVTAIPANLDFDAAFGEPLACAVSGARRTKVDLGDRVAIVGLGFMGTLMTQLLRLKGPVEIVGIDLREDARRAGLRIGCDVTLAPEQVDKDGAFDVVVEATGTPEGLTLATALTRLHGVLSILGYHQGGPRSVDMQLWNYRALEVLNAHERRVDYRMDCMRRGLALAAAGRINLGGLATHKFPLERLDDAFAALAGKPPGFVKSVVVVEGRDGAAPVAAASRAQRTRA